MCIQTTPKERAHCRAMFDLLAHAHAQAVDQGSVLYSYFHIHAHVQAADQVVHVS